MKIAKLLPRDDKFYMLIGALAEQTRQSAAQLKLYVESTDENTRAQAGRAIVESKARAKALLAQVTEGLCATFVTPFDREDIQDFSADLYRITKMIEKVYERMSLHNLVSERGDFSRQVDLITEEAEAMNNMIEALLRSRNSKEIVARAQDLHKIEQRGDAVLGELLVALFKDDHDVRDLILRKDIYDMLEKVIDRYRDAAGVALQIVLKHS